MVMVRLSSQGGIFTIAFVCTRGSLQEQLDFVTVHNPSIIHKALVRDDLALASCVAAIIALNASRRRSQALWFPSAYALLLYSLAKVCVHCCCRQLFTAARRRIRRSGRTLTMPKLIAMCRLAVWAPWRML